jgi:hypothetical protein
VTPSSEHTSSHNGNSPSSRSSFQGDLLQAQTHLDWWFGPALAKTQRGTAEIVLATISRKGQIAFKPFDTTLAAARWAVEESARSNLYLHIALHAPNRPNGKGRITTALYLPGLIADLDAKSPFRASNHGKAPDMLSLRLLIRDFHAQYRLPLTLITSGYGIYACVRFREPLFLEDEKARKEANNLLIRFGEAFRISARQHAWPLTVDSVYLSGLVRLSGSWNRKADPPVPVHFSPLVDEAAR